MDFGLDEMKIVRNNPSSVKSDPHLTRINDFSPLGSDLSEVDCIYIYIHILYEVLIIIFPILIHYFAEINVKQRKSETNFITK